MTDPPDVVAARDHVREELVRFGRALRRAGAAVPANAATTGARALVEVGFEETDARAALRACLVTDRDELPTFERLFPEFWRRLTAGLDASGPAPRPDDAPDGALAPIGGDAAESEDASDADASTSEEDDGDATVSLTQSFGAVVSSGGDSSPEATETALYSPTGSPTAVESGPLPADPGFGRAFDALTAELAGLRGRRWGPGEERADVRRALRSSVGTGGAVVSLPGRGRKRTAVRAVLLVDVSRSVLDTLDRGFLLRFLRHARSEWRDARVFFFDEHPREVTGAFDAPSTAAAMDALEAAEAEWGGGTRIGGSLREVRETAPQAVDRRTVTFVVSDGLETGDVAALERELSRLSRRGRALFWLNPLAAAPGYEPTARGMAAARPFLDGLFAFTGPGDVAEIARQLRRAGPGGRVGYEFDPRREVES